MATDVAESRRHHHVGVVVGHAVIGLTDHIEIGWPVNMVGAHQPTIVRDGQRGLGSAGLYANGAAYSDVVSVYAALGWNGLREVARVVMAVTSGRG